MKTAVSIPDQLHESADALARQLGISRSKLHQLALESYIKQRKDAEITAAINRAVERDGGLGEEDEGWLELSRRTIWDQLKDDKWE